MTAFLKLSVVPFTSMMMCDVDLPVPKNYIDAKLFAESCLAVVLAEPARNLRIRSIIYIHMINVD
jgi:hypothetical protein